LSLLAKVRVRVPASTSNIGPGFDCLGMALGLYNELVVEMHSEKGPLSFEIEGEGAETLPRDRGNVMFRAANTVLAGRFPNRLVFKAVNRIPLARGLGSSAAAIVAGLFAANRLIKPSPLTQEQLFEYALVLEGHPDNIAAAIFGGVTLSIKDRRDVRNHALKPHKDLVAVVCIPEFQLETAKARAVLPDIVPREAAVENVSRAMLLASAMERGRWKDLAAAMGDRLHQPYRACLVPGFKDVLKAATTPAFAARPSPARGRRCWPCAARDRKRKPSARPWPRTARSSSPAAWASARSRSASSTPTCWRSAARRTTRP